MVIRSQEGILLLPPIWIEPEAGAEPLVNRIRVTQVDGNSKGRQLLHAAYSSGADLPGGGQPLLEKKKIRPTKALRLKSQAQLPPGDYVVHAEVAYQPRNPFGTKAYGNEISRVATRTLQVPGDLDVACFLQVDWMHRELTVGGRDAELAIHVVNLPEGAEPVVSVFDPDHQVLPALHQVLSDALSRARPERVPNDSPPQEEFRQRISLPMSVERFIHAAINGKPVPVPLRVSIERRNDPAGVKEIAAWMGKDDQSLLVDFVHNRFTGYPILDLGTSSTFALIRSANLRKGKLPVEQERVFRARINEFLVRTDGPFGMPDWDAVIAGVASDLRIGERGATDPVQDIRAHLAVHKAPEQETDKVIHQVLKALESRVMNRSLSAQFRLALRHELSEMYSSAFRRFPLEELQLIAVELDSSDEHFGRSTTRPIPSTAEVTNLSPELTLEMGFAAEEARQKAAIADPASVVTRFHLSPKNYYHEMGLSGKTVPVSQGGNATTVSPRTFIRAALVHLRSRMEKFRDQCPRLQFERERKFDKAVITIPAAIPMRVRQELESAARDSGFDRPILTMDEAVSAITFYLINPFGNDRGIGLEAYRASCRPTLRDDGLPPQEWTQNVLLIDVGGGTTDIALVKVRLKSEENGQADAARGRTYHFVPELLGVTGREQLAGNQLSLCIYHELKRRLADNVLTALAREPRGSLPTFDEDPPTDDETAPQEVRHSPAARVQRLLRLAARVPEPFRQPGSERYRPLSLLEHYDIHQLWERRDQDDNPEHPPSMAVELAKRAIPTDWKNQSDPTEASERARTFHLLWRLAEEIKIHRLGGSEGESAETVTVTLDQIAEILGLPPELCQSLGIVSLTIATSDLLAAIDKRIEQIAELAYALARSKLVKSGTDAAPLDRLIVSGQTCRLKQVRDVITRKFSELSAEQPALLWDPTSLTFEGEYAKRAAALGAAYAQRNLDSQLHADGTSVLSGNRLIVELRNLFQFLQCGFVHEDATVDKSLIPLLSPGTPFTNFDDDGVGRIASAWHRPPNEIVVKRFDFAGSAIDPWGSFECHHLRVRLGFSENEFRRRFLFAIESDQRLIVSILFCCGERPHYQLPGNIPRISVPSVLRNLGLLARPEDSGETEGSPGSDDWMTALGGWIIGANYESGAENDLQLFVIGPNMFDRTFRNPDDGSTRRGGQSRKPLHGIPNSGKDVFFILPKGDEVDWIRLGELARPETSNGSTDHARVILDETGELRVVAGELPFAFAARDEEVLDEGLVLRQPLICNASSYEESKDPFCGRH
ncbi:MAG: hypothetical protein IT428_24515 [Planctomycetaceae bacterium]|nr:hypothetical protein [Planctomycetaceae bacterium]